MKKRRLYITFNEEDYSKYKTFEDKLNAYKKHIRYRCYALVEYVECFLVNIEKYGAKYCYDYLVKGKRFTSVAKIGNISVNEYFFQLISFFDLRELCEEFIKDNYDNNPYFQKIIDMVNRIFYLLPDEDIVKLNTFLYRNAP